MNVHMDITNLHNISLQLRCLKINVCLSSQAWGYAPATCSPQDPDPYCNDAWARGELWLALISSELVDRGSKTLVWALVLLCPSVRNWSASFLAIFLPAGSGKNFTYKQEWFWHCSQNTFAKEWSLFSFNFCPCLSADLTVFSYKAKDVLTIRS